MVHTIKILIREKQPFREEDRQIFNAEYDMVNVVHEDVVERQDELKRSCEHLGYFSSLDSAVFYLGLKKTVEVTRAMFLEPLFLEHLINLKSVCR